MKKISIGVLLIVFCTATVFGQDAATQQQLDKLSGQIQDLIDAQAQEGKRIDALEKQVSDLGDKVNTPAVNNSASTDDLKALTEKVQEIDKKRQDDRDLILKQIAALGSIGGGSSRHVKPIVDTTLTTGGDTTTPDVAKSGYYYVVKEGDTISAIAKAYRDSDKHVKVTSSQILAANPGLDATKLYAGKKIFIPDPNAQ